MLHINDQSVNDEPRIAFGSGKSSGIGLFGGYILFEEFTTYQWVSSSDKAASISAIKLISSSFK